MGRPLNGGCAVVHERGQRVRVVELRGRLGAEREPGERGPGAGAVAEQPAQLDQAGQAGRGGRGVGQVDVQAHRGRRPAVGGRQQHVPAHRGGEDPGLPGHLFRRRDHQRGAGHVHAGGPDDLRALGEAARHVDPEAGVGDPGVGSGALAGGLPVDLPGHGGGRGRGDLDLDAPAVGRVLLAVEALGHPPDGGGQVIGDGDVEQDGMISARGVGGDGPCAQPAHDGRRDHDGDGHQDSDSDPPGLGRPARSPCCRVFASCHHRVLNLAVLLASVADYSRLACVDVATCPVSRGRPVIRPARCARGRPDWGDGGPGTDWRCG